MRKKRDNNENENPKKKSKIFLAILSLIIIGVLSFGGFYLYRFFYSESTNSINNKENVVKNYVDIGDTIVKLSDDDKKRYLKLNIAVGYDKGNSKAKKQLKKNEQLPVVKDAINFYLMSKKSDFFSGDYENKLKDELISTINKKIQDFKITDIKISNLIIQ